MSAPDPKEELRRIYPPILTTAHVAEMMHCTIGDVRDKVHRKELKAMRWGQQFRFFRDEVIAAMLSVGDEEDDTELASAASSRPQGNGSGTVPAQNEVNVAKNPPSATDSILMSPSASTLEVSGMGM